MNSGRLATPRRRRSVAVALLVMLGACGDGSNRAERAHLRPTGRLGGTWALTMQLERRMSLSGAPATLPFALRGTVTMMPNERSDVSFAVIADPTDIGVYALRLDSLGLPPWQEGDLPALVAREQVTRSPASGAFADSILVVLNPGTPGRMIRLRGALAGDVAHGEWTAESPLGGGGTFDLRRITAPVVLPR